jgi:hypothetical protein
VGEALTDPLISEGTPALRLGSKIQSDPIDPVQFARMKAAFERGGGKVLQGEEVDTYLRWRQVEGLTDNAKQILLPSAPSRSAVFEEFLHTAQHRTGMVDDLITRYGNAEAERLLEIQAAEKLITNRQAYGISNDATRATIERLRALRAGGQ